MSKVALFDADGVVIKPREKYFSQRLVDEFMVSQDTVNDFVNNGIIPAMTNKADVKEKLSKIINEWHLSLSVDQMLDYWWSGESIIDENVIDVIDNLRSKGIHCYIVSDQEKYKANFLLKSRGLENHFDGSFLSFEVGYTKSETKFWEFVINKISRSPNDLYYWDDDEKNVEFAKQFGIRGYYYTDFKEFKKQVSKL